MDREIPGQGSLTLSRRAQLVLKRVFDLTVSAISLLILSPLLLAIAVAIRVSMGPPVLFRQERLGWRGQPFPLLKFRTMTERRDAERRLLPDALRLTPLGRLLRVFSLDELPELVNVLRGEMSLVGPRPLLVEYRDLYTAEQMRRHEMPPGMAGPVIARGRNTLSWEDKFALDVWYVDNWSLWLDLRILAATVWQVLKREGVSAAGHATMPPFGGSKAE